MVKVWMPEKITAHAWEQAQVCSGQWPSLPVLPPKGRDLERGRFPCTRGPRRKAKASLGSPGPGFPATFRKVSPGVRGAWRSLRPASLDVSCAQKGGGGGHGCMWVFKALMKNISPQLSWEDAHSLCHVFYLQILQGGPRQVCSCEYGRQSLFLYYCFLITVVFSARTTVNLLWPHPVVSIFQALLSECLGRTNLAEFRAFV